jgi:purine-cytosine permease-like protein
VVCIALALVLPMHSLEPFLLLLSSVFVPLYGVILGRLGTGTAPVQSPERRVDWTAAVIWLAGIAAYHACAKWAPQWGSALPTLATTFVLAWLTRPSSAQGGASALAQNRG